MEKYAFHTKQTLASFMGSLCFFFINKLIRIYANTLNVNNFRHFKMLFKVIKCYKSLIMYVFVMQSYPTHFQAMCVFEIDL